MNALANTPFTPDDDAHYIEESAGMLERMGRPLTANTLRAIAGRHRELAGPWRGLYTPDRLPERSDEGCVWHPDLPDWPNDEERDITPLVAAQGFELRGVEGEHDIGAEAMEDGGEVYFAALRAWTPTPPDPEGWRLAAVADTEDGPMAWFVRPRQEPEANGHG